MPAEQQENDFQFDNDFDFDDASYQWRLNKTYTGKGIFQYKQEAISSSVVTRSRSQSFPSSKKRKNSPPTFASIGSCRTTRSQSDLGLKKGNHQEFHEVEHMSNPIYPRSQRITSTLSNSDNGMKSCKRRNIADISTSLTPLFDKEIRITHSKLREVNQPVFHDVNKIQITDKYSYKFYFGDF
jgi:hypothetical protein